MKLLYIGNYRDGTGWGEAALNNILALNTTGIDVVCRPITFNGGNSKVPKIIDSLESKTTKGSDVCVQHTLPHFYHYNGKMKNICMYETETLTFNDTGWPKFINTMDQAWVPTTDTRDTSLNSGVKIPIGVVPHCLPIEKYVDQGHAEIEELKNGFNFCFVGEFIERKNLGAILRAFHTEFHPSEPVNIFFKISKAGKNSDECIEEFKSYSEHIRRGLKIRKNYKKEVVVGGILEKTQLISLVAQCHCFVLASHGEAWCYPALEAMALGLPIIYPHKVGVEDYAVGLKVESIVGPCHSATDSLPNIYTANSNWVTPNILGLQQAMRDIYELWANSPTNYKKMSLKAKESASHYDHRAIGQIMLGVLNATSN